MNNKFLVLTSFLAALLCHLFIFNYCTIVFPIDPADPKPKLYFIGSTLKQGEVKQASSKELALRGQITSNHSGLAENDPEDIHYETAASGKNPFAIQAIKKPLISQTANSEEKAILKATFETSSDAVASEMPSAQSLGPELEIQPYRSLRFRVP